MSSKSAPTAEMIGSEKLNIKYHYFVMIYNIQNECSDSIRGGDRGNLVAYQGALDTFFDLLCGVSGEDKIVDLKDVKNIRKNLADKLKSMYIANDATTRINYYIELKKYQNLLFKSIRLTGLIQAQLSDLMAGSGELEDGQGITKFPEPVEYLDDKRDNPLTKEEKSKISNYKPRAINLDLIDSDFDDDAEE